MFRVDVERTSDVAARLVLEGDLDVRTSPELRERLESVLQDGVRQVIVDLNHVEYLDSTGLGALVRGLQQTRRVDGDLKIVCDSIRVRRIFQIAGLSRVLEILPSSADDSTKNAADRSDSAG